MSLENVLNGFKQAILGRSNPPFFNGVNASMQTAFAVAPGSTNIALVTITMQDGYGNVVTGAQPMTLWLSDAATGIGLTSTTASGVVVAGASGADFGDLTAKKAKVVQPNALGVYILSITDAAKTGFFIAVKNPFTGQTSVSPQLLTANYG